MHPHWPKDMEELKLIIHSLIVKDSRLKFTHLLWDSSEQDRAGACPKGETDYNKSRPLDVSSQEGRGEGQR